MFAVCTLGAAEVGATGFPLIQASNQITGNDDPEGFGETACYSSLGVTALPYPVTEEGWCEGFVVRDAAGLDGVILGARDQRAASIYGNLQPGDSILHSTGPKLSSMVMCKEDRKQVVLRTKDSADKDMMIVMDGTDDKIMVTGFKTILEMTRTSITLGIDGGAQKSSITLTDQGECIINASKVFLGSGATPATPIVLGPAGISGVGSASLFGSLVMSGLGRRIRRLLANIQLGYDAFALQF